MGIQNSFVFNELILIFHVVKYEILLDYIPAIFLGRFLFCYNDNNNNSDNKNNIFLQYVITYMTIKNKT